MASSLILDPAQANAAHHPQHMGGRRGRLYGKRRRARQIEAHVAQGLVAIEAQLASAAPIPLATAALAWANAYIGHPYRVFTGCRCQPSCYAQDCSGLICAACTAVGAGFGCMSSFAIAQLCRQHGTLISEDEAIHTPGAIGIENPWGSPNGPSGSNGHVVWFVGDGATTTEEMGTAYGCVHGPATGRGFGAWARIPTLSYAPPAPPPPKVPPMFNPNKQLAARLRNPGVPGQQIGGWWDGFDNGLVDFLGDDGSEVHGGMNSPNDLKAFAGHGEHLAHINLRKRSNGLWGYSITAQSGSSYIPEAQA
jgi:hypothetical protein